jgi:Fic family protein
MTTDTTIRALDNAYVPFPSFNDWADRTSVDTVRWERYNNDLTKRAVGLSPEVLERARSVAKRAAAIDTGAIEGLYDVDRGFTFTVAFEASAWEAALAQKGEDVRSLFEAQLHAYDYVLDLATNAQPISEAAIRKLHEEVCQAQGTYHVVTGVGPQLHALPKGQYKLLPNHVHTRKGTDHSYAPVDITPTEMQRFVSELRSERFLAAHPVLQAAYAHYAFVAIHPFSDGNGRVARALASAFTYRKVSMPIVILVEHKTEYFDSLESADNGDYQSFVDFILARSVDTISLVDENVRCAGIPSVEESLSAIKALYTTRGGYTQQQIDQAGEKLITSFNERLSKAASTMPQGQIGYSFTLQSGVQYPLPGGYRTPVHGGRGIQLVLHTAQPIAVNTNRTYFLLLPLDAAGDDDVQLAANVMPGGVEDRFLVKTEDLISLTSGILEIRLSMFTERVLAEMLQTLNKNAEETARARGYRS